MAKMYFAKTVKYNNQVYPPNTVFDVRDEDIDELKIVGGWLIESEPKKEKIEVATTVEPEEVPEEVDELNELRKFAKGLGIRVKKSWDEAKLKAEIIKAQEE